MTTAHRSARCRITERLAVGRPRAASEPAIACYVDVIRCHTTGRSAGAAEAVVEASARYAKIQTI